MSFRDTTVESHVGTDVLASLSLSYHGAVRSKKTVKRIVRHTISSNAAARQSPYVLTPSRYPAPTSLSLAEAGFLNLDLDSHDRGLALPSAMADPLSITGLVLAVGGVIQTVVQYCSSVREATKEIRTLTTELLAELFALQGALAQLDSEPQHGARTKRSRLSGPEFESMLQSADQALASLAESLAGGGNSKFGPSAQKFQWHWRKEEVQRHIQRIQRIKVWFILMLTTDIL